VSSISQRNESAEPDWRKLERTIGVRFKERALLKQAAVHRSFLNEHPESGLESYERLEYLGDAFLGWVVAGDLYARHPSFDEGDLTRARAALVRGSTLADVAGEIGLGAYLYLGQGEEASGGRIRPSNLAAAVEALLGAVLIDRGEQAARKLVMRWLGDRIAAIGPDGTPRDAKSALQELTQRGGLPLPVYELLTEEGPSHARHYTVRVVVDGVPRGNGAGRRKAEAEQDAAAEAIQAIEPSES
jgi:ribonuclease-3